MPSAPFATRTQSCQPPPAPNVLRSSTLLELAYRSLPLPLVLHGIDPLEQPCLKESIEGVVPQAQ